MGNASTSKPIPIHNSDDYQQSVTSKYQCKYHRETEFDKIQISPTYHRLIIDGYIHQNCSSLYILPNDISMICQNMVWGLDHFMIILDGKEFKTLTIPKEMNNDSMSPIIDDNGNDNKIKRDSKNYDMNTLYHERKGIFNFYGIPFKYILKSDGINHITLSIETHFKSRIIAQICLFCQETNDLIRFWDYGTLRISIKKCKYFNSLHFLCKSNIMEMHQIISARKCKTFYNECIKIEENSKYKYKLNKNILLLMDKQSMNRYYLKPFGIDNNWGLSITHRHKSNLLSIQLELLKLPYSLTIDVLFKYKIIINNNICIENEQCFLFSIPTKICGQREGGLETRAVFKNEKEIICLSEIKISGNVKILKVIGINGEIAKNQWNLHGISCGIN